MDNHATTNRYERWIKGVNHCVYTKKMRTQVYIAKECGIESQSLNAILKERQGKKASSDLQDRICVVLGYAYEEMLSLGQHIIETGSAEGWTKPSAATMSGMIGFHGSMVAETKKTQSRPLPISGDQNLNKIIAWVNAQDEPAEHWIELKNHLRRLEPDFADFLKKDHYKDVQVAQNGSE